MNVCWSVLVLTLVTTAGAWAQFVPSINLYTSYTDNLFQTHDGQSDWITQAYIDLDYAPSGPLRFYYAGNASVFSQFEDLFSHTHQAGLSYYKPKGENDLLYGRARLSARLDRAIYSYRDFVQGEVYGLGKFYLRPTLLGRGGFALRYWEYVNERDYSYIEQEVFGKISQFLPSRTTLQADSELGVKTYVRARPQDPRTLLETRSGNGRSLIQLVSRFKVAQALTQGTGLQLEYQHRANLAGQIRFADPNLYDPDADLFDDRYSYAGHHYRTALKHLGVWEVELEASAQWEQRRYQGRPALDLDGIFIGDGVTRKDRRTTLAMGLERSFGWEREVVVQLDWLYREVDSNDPYYSGVSQTLSTGVQFGF